MVKVNDVVRVMSIDKVDLKMTGVRVGDVGIISEIHGKETELTVYMIQVGQEYIYSYREDFEVIQ